MERAEQGNAPCVSLVIVPGPTESSAVEELPSSSYYVCYCVFYLCPISLKFQCRCDNNIRPHKENF